MKKPAVFLNVLTLFLCLAPVSFAYEVIPFRNGGRIEGIVEFTGAVVPKDKTFTVSSDVKYCGKELRTEKYLINAQRRIKNVVVYLKEIKAGKAMPQEPATVVDSKCMFAPHVSVAYQGNKLLIRNEDPMLHTGHIYSSLRGKTVFNVALPEKGSVVTKPLTKTGPLELNCDCHPWMEGFVYVIDHPYVTVTDADGAFVLDDIPAGTYTVEAWHESLGVEDMADITVQSGKTATVKLKFTGKEKGKSAQ